MALKKKKKLVRSVSKGHPVTRNLTIAEIQSVVWFLCSKDFFHCGAGAKDGGVRGKEAVSASDV